jgi:transcriptional regulator with XRE-family HTH domain
MEKRSGNPTRKSDRKDAVVRAAFARVIVDLRRQLRLKQSQVADGSGYSEKYSSNLERRINTSSLTAAIEIASALHVDATDILAQTLLLMSSFKRLERKDPLAADE